MTLLHTLVGTARRAVGAAGTWFGLLRTAGGPAELALGASVVCSRVAMILVISYVLIDTPLTTQTSLSTLVGTVPGALPPVIGWSAATGEISAPALVLFGIVFLWQIPHFLAITWLYRDDDARAGIPLLPVPEPDEKRTGQAFLYAAALWPVSLMPAVVGLADLRYSLVGTCLGFVFIWLSARFARQRSAAMTRLLFLFPIVYLPLLVGALVLARRT